MADVIFSWCAYLQSSNSFQLNLLTAQGGSRLTQPSQRAYLDAILARVVTAHLDKLHTEANETALVQFKGLLSECMDVLNKQISRFIEKTKYVVVNNELLVIYGTNDDTKAVVTEARGHMMALHIDEWGEAPEDDTNRNLLDDVIDNIVNSDASESAAMILLKQWRNELANPIRGMHTQSNLVKYRIGLIASLHPTTDEEIYQGGTKPWEVDLAHDDIETHMDELYATLFAVCAALFVQAHSGDTVYKIDPAYECMTSEYSKTLWSNIFFNLNSDHTNKPFNDYVHDGLPPMYNPNNMENNKDVNRVYELIKARFSDTKDNILRTTIAESQDPVSECPQVSFSNPKKFGVGTTVTSGSLVLHLLTIVLNTLSKEKKDMVVKFEASILKVVFDDMIKELKKLGIYVYEITYGGDNTFSMDIDGFNSSTPRKSYTTLTIDGKEILYIPSEEATHPITLTIFNTYVVTLTPIMQDTTHTVTIKTPFRTDKVNATAYAWNITSVKSIGYIYTGAGVPNLDGDSGNTIEIQLMSIKLGDLGNLNFTITKSNNDKVVIFEMRNSIPENNGVSNEKLTLLDVFMRAKEYTKFDLDHSVPATEIAEANPKKIKTTPSVVSSTIDKLGDIIHESFVGWYGTSIRTLQPSTYTLLTGEHKATVDVYYDELATHSQHGLLKAYKDTNPMYPLFYNIFMTYEETRATGTPLVEPAYVHVIGPPPYSTVSVHIIENMLRPTAAFDSIYDNFWRTVIMYDNETNYVGKPNSMAAQQHPVTSRFTSSKRCCVGAIKLSISDTLEIIGIENAGALGQALMLIKYIDKTKSNTSRQQQTIVVKEMNAELGKLIKSIYYNSVADPNIKCNIDFKKYIEDNKLSK
jgi:hypothetical protein